MYVALQKGQAAAVTAASALHLGTFRRNILAVVVGNELFTNVEQLKTNDSVYQTECPSKLALWLKNVRRLASERAQAQGLAQFAEGLERGRQLLAAAPKAATPSQCDELYRLACHPALPAADKGYALALLPTLTEGAALALIGRLYHTMLRRCGQGSWRDGSTLAVA